MKWEFLIIGEDYDIYGTNDAEEARRCAEFQIVVDCTEGKELGWPKDTRAAEELVVKEYPYDKDGNKKAQNP